MWQWRIELSGSKNGVESLQIAFLCEKWGCDGEWRKTPLQAL
jgi:hypothetical protein